METTCKNRLTYEPINILKEIDEDIWIVDGEIINYALPIIPFIKIPFSTRMTVIRIGEALFIHSPTALTQQLKNKIDLIGTPTWIIAPNRIHYWWIPTWKNAYPDAKVYLAPGITTKQAIRYINFPTHQLEKEIGYPWDNHILTLPITSSYMTEFEFFHQASKTLILTDLIENFEPEKLNMCMCWLAKLGGILAPDGQMPRDMRLTFRDKNYLRRVVEKIISWNPQRVILAHGRCYHKDAVIELRRAFRWLLER